MEQKNSKNAKAGFVIGIVHSHPILLFVLEAAYSSVEILSIPLSEKAFIPDFSKSFYSRGICSLFWLIYMGVEAPSASHINELTKSAKKNYPLA